MSPRILMLVLFVSAVILSLIDGPFITALGYPFHFVNITLIAAIYSATLFTPRAALGLFALSNIFSSLTHGHALISPLIIGFFVIAIISQLAENLFTNRTYYALALLGICGWLLWHLFSLVFAFVAGQVSLGASVVFLTTPNLVLESLVSLFIMQLILFVAYAMTVSFSKRLKSYFIVSTRSSYKR